MYLFDTQSYTIETGGRDPAAREFCRLLQQLKNEPENSPLIDALRKVDLEASLSTPLVKLGVKGKLDLIIELLYSIKALSNIKSRNVQILIKGYADGKHADWNRSLVQHYEYETISVHPPVNPNSLNPMVYLSGTQALKIPNPYENKHLPDLRSKFVEEDLILPVLSQCPGASHTDVQILKGYEFSKPDNPNLRRVEVQVNVF